MDVRQKDVIACYIKGEEMRAEEKDEMRKYI